MVATGRARPGVRRPQAGDQRADGPSHARRLVALQTVPSTTTSRGTTGEPHAGGGAFAIENALKDISYFVRLSEANATYTPVADTIRRFYGLAVALGYGEEMLPQLFRLQGQLSGVEIDLTLPE